MPTIRDLVKLCPGCGTTVVWPFTQDFDLRRIKLAKDGLVVDGRVASDDEMEILRKLIPSIAYAIEIGVRVQTIDDKGVLWHEPCFLLNDFRMRRSVEASITRSNKRDASGGWDHIKKNAEQMQILAMKKYMQVIADILSVWIKRRT